MRCRHFTIRLSPEHAQEDEAALNEFMRSVEVQSVQTALGAAGRWSVLIFYKGAGATGEEPGAGVAAPKVGPPSTEELSDEERRVYERLRAWRSRRAAAEGKPPYIIANNAVLIEIARRHMSIRVADDLAKLKQFGPARAERYGPEILQLLYLIAAGDEEPLFDEER